MFAEKPHKDIYNFVGNFTMVKMCMHIHLVSVVMCVVLTFELTDGS